MGCNYLSIPKPQRQPLKLGNGFKWFHPTLYWPCDYLCMPGYGRFVLIREVTGIISIWFVLYCSGDWRIPLPKRQVMWKYCPCYGYFMGTYFSIISLNFLSPKPHYTFIKPDFLDASFPDPRDQKCVRQQTSVVFHNINVSSECIGFNNFITASSNQQRVWFLFYNEFDIPLNGNLILFPRYPKLDFRLMKTIQNSCLYTRRWPI